MNVRKKPGSKFLIYEGRCRFVRNKFFVLKNVVVRTVFDQDK